MKLKKLVLAAIVCSIGFTQCKKDDSNDSSSFSGSKLLKVTYYYNGAIESSSTYQYDARGRVSKVTSDDDYFFTVEYSASMVKVIEYDKQRIQDTITYVLNSKGLAISENYSSSPEKKARINYNSHSKMALASVTESAGQATFEYDANGYRIKDIYVNGSGGYTNTYEISAGNTVSRIEKFENSTLSTTCLFLTDKTNTIGVENMGVSFIGKQDVNLRSSETITYTDNSTPSTTINYTYEYDSKNRVTKKTSVSVIGTRNFYETYTYTD